MIGAAGLLFAEHKKDQKEQQKKAAIEALGRGAHSDTDSSGCSYAHTGAYSHSDTDSSDYRAPAFMASDYMGTWYSKDGLVTLSIDDLT